MSELDKFIFALKSVVYMVFMLMFLAMYDATIIPDGEMMPGWVVLVVLFVVPFIFSMPYFGKATE